eukprot:1423201-Karenia_brevis.AAC.1
MFQPREGIFATFDTGCNACCHGFCWRNNYDRRLQNLRIRDGVNTGIFSYWSAVHEDLSEEQFGGVSGEHACM